MYLYLFFKFIFCCLFFNIYYYIYFLILILFFIFIFFNLLIFIFFISIFINFLIFIFITFIFLLSSSNWKKIFFIPFLHPLEQTWIFFSGWYSHDYKHRFYSSLHNIEAYYYWNILLLLACKIPIWHSWNNLSKMKEHY